MRFFCILLFVSLSIFPYNWTPRIKVKNGTTGNLATVDLKLILLSGGMLPFYEAKNMQGEFSLPTQVIDDESPVLIQVNYKGVNYNKIVPPVPKFRDTTQEIIVYETTEEKKFLTIKGLIQVSKRENHLLVNKLYLLNNKSNPKLTILNSKGLEVFIPKEAQEITAQLLQGEKGMPIPLSLSPGNLGQVIQRPILPGESSLHISYLISSTAETIELEDKLIFEKENETLLFIKPTDMKVSSSNLLETISSEEIPEGMKAYRVKYDESRTVKLSFRGGSFENEFPKQRKIVNGTIFDTPEKSILGVIAVLAFLYSLYFLFHPQQQVNK